MFWRALVGLSVGSQLSCQTGQAIAPPASEPVPVTVSSRTASPGETLPAAHVSGGAGSIEFHVKRAGFCLAVDARLSREPNDLAIIGHVIPQLPDCASPPQNPVIEYEGTIRVKEPGDYRVRIFDADDDTTPHLIESTVVTVS
jgi:hypothetical protein